MFCKRGLYGTMILDQANQKPYQLHQLTSMKNVPASLPLAFNKNVFLPGKAERQSGITGLPCHETHELALAALKPQVARALDSMQISSFSSDPLRAFGLKNHIHAKSPKSRFNQPQQLA